MSRERRTLGFEVWGLGFGFWGLGFGFWGLGFGVWISNSRGVKMGYIGKRLIIHGSEETIDEQPFIEITFIDYGIGIPSEVLDKIFNPFFSTKPSGKVTGLGLAISHGIISDHGGKLLFESNEGEYTKVLIFFPAITENA